MPSSRLASALKRGDRRALAKAITLAESRPREAASLVGSLKPEGRAFVVGITGPPGTGKSTLVDRMIEFYRKKGLKVGVVAVDPTSPITGGALLGDRVRMSSHASDPKVYIRSMASRGWSGGLSRATALAIQLMDAAGFDVVLLETVGIGQADIEVVGVSHAVLVVLMPGLGDDIQVSKAGLMEVGDVYVVNKADIPGADSMYTSLLGLVRTMRGRSPEVVRVSARTGEGLERLGAVVEKVRSKFASGDKGLRVRSARGLVVETARGMVLEKFARISDGKADSLALKVAEGESTVADAAAQLLKAA